MKAKKSEEKQMSVSSVRDQSEKDLLQGDQFCVRTHSADDGDRNWWGTGGWIRHGGRDDVPAISASRHLSLTA